MKRKATNNHSVDRKLATSKRPRLDQTDRLSQLSDELLLRILSHLSVQDLTTCQRVSHKFEHIAGDSQLWRVAYYDQWVRPRFHRLPKSRRSARGTRLTRWLDEAGLVEKDAATDWKRQYKLRHRWSRGSCDVNEIPVASRPPTPPLVARLHDGIVFTVDSSAGLRAWSYKGQQKLLSSHHFSEQNDRIPTSLALDANDKRPHAQRMAIGFEDGSFDIIQYSKTEGEFRRLHSAPPSSNGMISTVAYASPYLLSMSERQYLALYSWITADMNGEVAEIGSEQPKLLTLLKSHTVWPPQSLSLRIGATRIVAAIAYSMPTFNSGWTAGVQELHLSKDGAFMDSRLASALGPGFSLAQSKSMPAPITSRPTSLSYSHPYLLVSHADNTLTLYLVNSAASSLTVDLTKRLWGHTSGVFGAHVGGRGKAVSVSTRGDEIRVWELEGSNLARPGQDATSVQVTPEKISSKVPATRSVHTESGQESKYVSSWDRDDADFNITRAYAGFDEESVVIYREHDHGRQALAIYDFSK